MGAKAYTYVKGDKVGELTFLERADTKKGFPPKALFQCVCGNAFKTTIYGVRTGETKSCGCLTKQLIASYKEKFEEGQVVGNCKYLREAEYEYDTARKSYFLCVCGKEFVAKVRNIKSRETKSCGCLTLQLRSENGGNPERPLPEVDADFINKFWEKVDYSMGNTCWNWNATGKRYGLVSIKGKMFKSHRVDYLIAYKKDPQSLSVMHSCDNTKCCNPSHLSLGTHAENMRDMALKGRAKKRKIDYNV